MSSKNIYKPKQEKYCVYVTIYYGDKMPMYYIGSTSLKKIKRGYIGSVRSREFSEIWKSEKENNQQLFKTEILIKCHSRKYALLQEKFLQITLGVVKSNLFINKSIAAVNGFFGMNVTGKNNGMFGKIGELNPSFGKERSVETRQKISNANSGKGHAQTEDTRQKISSSTMGKKKTKEHAENISKAKKGVPTGRHDPIPENVKIKMSLAKLGKAQPSHICPHCGKAGGNAMLRWHFDKCPLFENY